MEYGELAIKVTIRAAFHFGFCLEPSSPPTLSLSLAEAMPSAFISLLLQLFHSFYLSFELDLEIALSLTPITLFIVILRELKFVELTFHSKAVGICDFKQRQNEEKTKSKNRFECLTKAMLKYLPFHFFHRAANWMD